MNGSKLRFYVSGEWEAPIPESRSQTGRYKIVLRLSPFFCGVIWKLIVGAHSVRPYNPKSVQEKTSGVWEAPQCADFGSLSHRGSHKGLQDHAKLERGTRWFLTSAPPSMLSCSSCAL